MLTWPQNNRNLISKDHNFKIFLGENVTGPSTGSCLWQFLSGSKPLLCICPKVEYILQFACVRLALDET